VQADSAPSRRRLRLDARAVAVALLLLALVLRIAEVQRTSYKAINDGGIYLRLGAEIANFGGYSSYDRGAGGARGPSAYFPPGYPYFIGGVDLIDGHAQARGAAIQPVRLSQAVLGTIAVGLIGLVALELFGTVVALVAMAIAAVYPLLIELAGVIVAENLLVVLELAAIWCVLRARRSPHRYRWVIAAGALVGLATLTHANAFLLVPPFAVALWGRPPRRSWRAVARPALLIAVAVLVIVPWTIRNAVELHHFIPVSDETGITLVGTYNAASAANSKVPYKWRIYQAIPGDRSLAHHAHLMSEPALDSRLTSQALDYIGDHPGAPFAAGFHNTLRLFELEGSFAWHASAAAIGLDARTAHVGVISFWLVCVLALIGAFTRAARSAPWWLWAIPVLLGLSVVLVNVETPRFREPIDPFFVLLAACAVATGLGATSLSPFASRASSPDDGAGRRC
jgi:4-amino-4-deoxy-L-arabinose transferase-like glycosyltransferase